MTQMIIEKGTAPAGAHLLSDIHLPAAAVCEPHLLHNIDWMQGFADQHHCLLAPHGKTTMTPAIYRRQLAAGAWGITLATATQCTVAAQHGVARILMANQLVGTPNMAIIAQLIDAGTDFYCLVDNADNIKKLDAFFGQRGLCLQVLIEIGVDGGRCGVRTDAQLNALIDVISQCPAIVLRGLEGYEGVIHTAESEHDVYAYGQRLASTLKKLRARNVLGPKKPIVTASGSKWFDLIARAFKNADLDDNYQPLLRPGCYVTHDHRLYKNAMADIRARQPKLKGQLEAALSVYAQVQSRPEPTLAIIAMGRRDISCNPDLPMPLDAYRDSKHLTHAHDMQVRDVMDQHTLINIPENADIKIGDIIRFGASHPCLTFDKWRHILLVDNNHRVREVMPTYF